MKKDKFFSLLKVIFPISLLLLVFIEIRHLFHNLDIHLLGLYMQQLSIVKITLIIILSFVAVSPMYFYDYILTDLLKIKVPTRQLMKYSVISNTFSNLLGFGGLIGASIRTYFYHEYEMDRRKLVASIASVSLFYMSGVSILSWFVVIGGFDSPLFQKYNLLYIAVIVVALYLPAYGLSFVIKGRHSQYNMMDRKNALKLIVVSLLEWIFIFIFIFILAEFLDIHISFYTFFIIFIIASCAGIASMIPGGLGTFDIVFLWGLQNLQVTDEKAIVLLLLYRLGYFLLPFLVGFFLLLKVYWRKWNRSWSNIPNMMLQNASHTALTGLIFVSGMVLLLSGSVPGILSRLTFIEKIISFPIMNISHQLSVIAGFLLLGLSRGIEYKEKRAYHLSMFVLILASLFSLFKGFDYEEAIFLLTVAILLKFSKKRFYRENFVLTWGKVIVDIAGILFFTSLYLIMGYANLPSAKFNLPDYLLPYVLLDSNDLFTSAAIGIIVAVSILVFGHYIRKPKTFPFEFSKIHEDDIKRHLVRYNGNELSHLIFLHDKFIFWTKAKDVLFAYKPIADKLVILGDPIGEKKNFFKAIEELRETADKYGYTPVFYQSSMRMLPYLHGNGYDFFKLGEEAFVHLDEHDLSGKNTKDATSLLSYSDHDHLSFRVLVPPFSDDVLKEIEYVSNEWLQGRKEKGFSLGFFDKDYLNKAPIALIENQDNKIIAFASLMSNYDVNNTISVDLMRQLPDSPSGTMDFLFLSLFDWANDNGYKRFNLGMAHLSNVGQSKFSFLSEKLASQIYIHSQYLYQLQSLRTFKERYADEWEPKYLAYRKKSSLPFTMVQVTMLISKERKE